MQKYKMLDIIFKAVILIQTLMGITAVFIGMSFMETEGDAVVLLVVGLALVFVVIPIYIAEFDLYYDIRYFMRDQEPKVRWKTILNAISAILSVLVLFSSATAVVVEVLGLTEWVSTELFLFFVGNLFGCYIIVRVLYLFIDYRYKRKRKFNVRNGHEEK